jgi:hypothetical protein
LVNDDSINEFEDESESWYKAEVLRIYNCSELELRLKKNADGIADQMNDKLLLIENIKVLRLEEFLVGVPTGYEDVGTVLLIIIEWALVVPWITRENVLLMFLAASTECSAGFNDHFVV